MVVDRSSRGKVRLRGAEAAEFLQGQVTNDVEALAPGEGCYAALLTHKGKMLGDLRVLAFERGLWLDTERVALQELFNVRSEEHTSELQSRQYLVCRLLLEKKKQKYEVAAILARMTLEGNIESRSVRGAIILNLTVPLCTIIAYHPDLLHSFFL